MIVDTSAIVSILLAEPGWETLDQLLQDVARACVNFVNAYGRTVQDGDSAFFVIDSQDIPDARARLAAVGLEILDDRRVYGIDADA